MAEAGEKPPTAVQLIWEHDLVFGGRSGGVTMTLDSASTAGPSPVQALVFGLAGCMAMDVVHVIRKGRHDLRGLRADLQGWRAPDVPHRLTRVELHFTITGDLAGDVIQRAIDLSREKYCSVWHSLREDITLDITFTAAPGV